MLIMFLFSFKLVLYLCHIRAESLQLAPKTCHIQQCSAYMHIAACPGPTLVTKASVVRVVTILAIQLVPIEALQYCLHISTVFIRQLASYVLQAIHIISDSMQSASHRK